MDYDKTAMPDAYDRARSFSPAVLRMWLELLSDAVPEDTVSDIVDLGCGTGRFSGPLAEHFGAAVVGIDPSEKMLAQARGKAPSDRVSYRQGAGEALPLCDSAADMVFMSMMYHHLADPAQTARECRRVLRDGGHVCLRNSTVERIDSDPHADFFPGVRAILAAEMPTHDQVMAVFAAAGFALARHELVRHTLAPSWPAYLDKVAQRADSILTRLPDAAFEAGLAAMRAHDPDEAPVTIDIDLFVFRRSEPV